MGIFSSQPALALPSTEHITVPDWLSGQIPDPGQMLLDLYDGVDTSVQQEVAVEIRRVRFSSGGYDLRESRYDKHSGPLGLLCWITTNDWISTRAWAVHGLKGTQKMQVKATVADLCRSRGIPVAATWVLIAWKGVDRQAPSVEVLFDMLASSYDEWLGKITNGMVINSIRKWHR